MHCLTELFAGALQAVWLVGQPLEGGEEGEPRGPALGGGQWGRVPGAASTRCRSVLTGLPVASG